MVCEDDQGADHLCGKLVEILFTVCGELIIGKLSVL
jgi:hypothetical protein